MEAVDQGGGDSKEMLLSEVQGVGDKGEVVQVELVLSEAPEVEVGIKEEVVQVELVQSGALEVVVGVNHQGGLQRVLGGRKELVQVL